MSSNRDQLQALIADIDGILRKMNSRLAWWSSGETRRVLERVRLYLDGQLASESPPGISTLSLQPSGPIAPYEKSEAAEAQAILQGLMQDLTGLRTSLMQPLQEEIATLRQERHSLMEEVRQLEQKQRHYSTLAAQQAHQQQAISDFLQALIGPLQESLSQEVSEAIAHLETQLLAEGLPDRLPQAVLESRFPDSIHALTEENSGLLSPQARLEQLQMLQGESDRLLMSLDSTLRVVFEALERNVNSYNDSLGQGLDKMHRLGQQGELMFSALVNHLAQLLGQETSSYLQSSLRLLASTQSAIENEVTPDSDPEPANPPSEVSSSESQTPPPEAPEPPPVPSPPQSSTPGAKSIMTEEESRELLEFPFAGAELIPVEKRSKAGESGKDPAQIDPPPVPKTREQMSQDNFEMAAQLADSAEEEGGKPSENQNDQDDQDDLFQAIGQELDPVADSNLDFEDLPEIDLEEWATPEEELSENWDLSASFESENLAPLSPVIPQSKGEDDLFAVPEEPNAQESEETSPSPYGEDDLFADLASRHDAPRMEGEYSEDYMDEFLFGDRLESMLSDGDAAIPEEIIPERSPLETASPFPETVPPREPEEPQAQKSEEPGDDLFADFETIPEAIADAIPAYETLIDGSTPSFPGDLPPEEVEEGAIASELDLAEDWDEDVYIQASPQEDLLVEQDLEEDLDNLWLSNTGIQRLDEDLSKLEEVKATPEPNRASLPESNGQGTELSAEQWLEDLAAEPPLSESVSLADLDPTLSWDEDEEAGLDSDEEAFLYDTEEWDPLAIALDSDFLNDRETEPAAENELTESQKPEGKTPEPAPAPSAPIESPETRTPAKAREQANSNANSNNVLPTLDDIFAELMATNPPPVVKVTAEEDVNHETVEDFFADFMDDDDEDNHEAIAAPDPEPESEQPEVPQSSDDDLTNPTLDNFFESWSDAPNVSHPSSSRSDGAG